MDRLLRLASPGNMKFGLGYMYGRDPEPNRLAAAAACFSAADMELDPLLFSRLLFSLEDFSDDLEDDRSEDDRSEDEVSFDFLLSLSDPGNPGINLDFLLSLSDPGNPGINPDPKPGRLNPEKPRRGFERFMLANPPKGNPNGFMGLVELDAVDALDDDPNGFMGLLELDPVDALDEDVFAEEVATDAAA